METVRPGLHSQPTTPSTPSMVTTPSIKSSASVKSSGSGKSGSSRSSQRSKRVPALVLPAKITVPAVVSWVVSAQEFYIQLKDKVPEIEQMTEKLVTASEFPACQDFSAGASCAAMFTEDGSWYRAEIMKESGDTAEVLFIDFGNRDTPPKSAIRSLTAELVRVPKLSIKCALHGVESVPKEDLEAALMEQEVEVEVLKEEKELHTVNVQLDGACVNEMFADVAQDLKPASSTVIPDQSLILGQKLEAYFLEASSPENFFCQPKSTEDELAKLMEDIAVYVESPTCAAVEFKVGDCCLAVYSTDGGWYRACITAMNSNNQVYIIIYYL